MTKNWIGLASDLRRTCVGHLVGALGVVFLTAGVAQAEAWEAFQARCLTPMEDVKSVNRIGLNFIGKRDGPQMLSVYLPASQGYLFMVVTDDSEASLGCSVNLGEGSSEEKQADFAAAFRAWALNEVAEDRYLLTSDENGEIELESNITREPVILVALWRQLETNNWVASVQETDRES